MVQKVARRLRVQGWATLTDDWKTHCQPGIFFESGKDKAAKGDGWALPSICRAQGSETPTVPRLSGYGKPLHFTFNIIRQEDHIGPVSLP